MLLYTYLFLSPKFMSKLLDLWMIYFNLKNYIKLYWYLKNHILYLPWYLFIYISSLSSRLTLRKNSVSNSIASISFSKIMLNLIYNLSLSLCTCRWIRISINKLRNCLIEKLNVSTYATHHIFHRTWRSAPSDPPRLSECNRRGRQCRAARCRNQNPPEHWFRPRTVSGRHTADSWPRVRAVVLRCKVEGQGHLGPIRVSFFPFFSRLRSSYLSSLNSVSGGRPGMNVITARNKPM